MATEKKGKVTALHSVPLWIVGQKYPDLLPPLAGRLPKDSGKDLALHELARAISESKLAKEPQAAILSSLARRLKPDQARVVLQNLAKIDPDQCEQLVLPIIKALPRDVEGAYWTNEFINITHVVMQLERDGVWKEFLAAAKRAGIGMRMEMMDPMDYSYIGDRNRARRLAFLAAFLDDEEVRVRKGAKFSGPCAAFKFDRIEVRNFAAMTIASILKVRPRPDQIWDGAKWTAYRDEIRDSLKRERISPPSSP
jgi:hypothetical protein